MNHIFIGSTHRKIFVSRLTARKQPCVKAVLLFYPFGQEYMRAHKAFRQLATLLSRKGFDVYRFDYLGTGDSYLDAAHADFNDYVDSGNQVLQYITQNHTYEIIDLVGLRLGSLVAANISKENIINVLKDYFGTELPSNIIKSLKYDY